MLNLKRRRNVATLLCFVLLALWNFKIGLDFLVAKLDVLALPSFLVVILFFSALVSSVRSRRKVLEIHSEYFAMSEKRS